MFSEKLEITLYQKKSCSMSSNTLGSKSCAMMSHYSWYNIAQQKLYAMFSQKFKTGQNFIQCCPRCSRQHWIKKIILKCCLNTLGTTLQRSKTYAMLPEKLQAALHKKILCCFVLILLGQHYTNQNPMHCCLKDSW